MTYGLPVYQQKESLKEDFFCFNLVLWTWARSSCNRIPSLVNGEAGVTPAGSTLKSVKSFGGF